MNSQVPKSELEKRLEGMTPAEQIKAIIEEVGECRKIIAEIKNPVRREMEKLTDISKKNADPDEELDDIPWLKAKYAKMHAREMELIDALVETLVSFDYRIKVLEEK